MDVESIFLSLLGQKEKLEWYLKNQTDLMKYIYQTSPGYMAIVDTAFLFIPKQKRKELLKDFNVDRLMGVLKRQRLDLYKVLVNFPNGRGWLSDQIKGFRGKFLK